MCCWRPQLPGMPTTVAPAPHVRRLGVAITIVAIVGILIATLFPDSSQPVAPRVCLICGSRAGVDAILNVVLFVPLGIGLGLIGVRARPALIGMCILSVLVETAQFFFIAGRDATLSDVVTNTLGGALGFAIGRYVCTLLCPSPRIGLALSVGWSAVWLAIQTISGFGFSPAMPSSEYYGQIARRLGNFELFEGRVLRASIGDVMIPDSRFPNSRRVRQLLLRGAPVTTIIVTARPTRGVAPIVRVADTRQREIMLLAQDSQNLTFGVRTGAVVLRLRGPVFTQRDLFPGASPRDRGLTTDTLIVTARYSAREVWLNVKRGQVSHVRRIPITASLGWTMLLPFEWFIEGTRTELVVNAIWVACLLLPMGYWGVGAGWFFRSQKGTRIPTPSVLTALALLYAGLVVVPHVFGVTGAPPSDWLAALTGILLGGILRGSRLYRARESGLTDGLA